MSPREIQVDVNVVGLGVFQDLLEVFQDLLEYCWHHRECSAIDADGDWRIGNDPCDCGYDEVIGRARDIPGAA